MAYKVEFIKTDKVNNKEYKKGDVLSVSSSLYASLSEAGSVKDFKAKKPKAKAEES